MAGTGARAARHLRAQSPDARSMFVLSTGDGGLLGTTIPAMTLAQGSGSMMMSNTMHEAMMRGVLGNALEALMEHMAQATLERSMQEQEPTIPPASQSARNAQPQVVVTKEDLLDSTNSKCSVCLEEFQAGTDATRMFCGHLFCTTCIDEWLVKANSCPVCRFELATDSDEYEAGRAQRMRDRVARFREGELLSLRVVDLRRVMVALGVSEQGCMEKGELITRLGATEGVEVTPDRKDICYEKADLQGLELPLLRSLLKRHRIPPLGTSESASASDDATEEEEHAEVLRRFAAAGFMAAGEIEQQEPADKPRKSASGPPTARSVANEPTEEEEQFDSGFMAAGQIDPPETADNPRKTGSGPPTSRCVANEPNEKEEQSDSGFIVAGGIEQQETADNPMKSESGSATARSVSNEPKKEEEQCDSGSVSHEQSTSSASPDLAGSSEDATQHPAKEDNNEVDQEDAAEQPVSEQRSPASRPARPSEPAAKRRPQRASSKA